MFFSRNSKFFSTQSLKVSLRFLFLVCFYIVDDFVFVDSINAAVFNIKLRINGMSQFAFHHFSDSVSVGADLTPAHSSTGTDV